MQHTELEMLYHKHLIPSIQQVEKTLQELEVHPALREMYVYAVSGGKRFRASLCSLGFIVCGGENANPIIPAAASLELLHKASLVHDDLVDADDLRRGRPSFHARYGQERAVILGDLLVAMGYRSLQNLKASSHQLNLVRQAFETAHLELCAGELLELTTAGDREAFAFCDDIIYGKTACLIEKSLEIGAILAQGEPSQIAAVGRYGRIMGTCFQIINDLNNLTDLDRAVKGRSCGDLADAKISVPLLEVKNVLGGAQFAALWQALTDSDPVRQNEAVETCRQLTLSPQVSARLYQRVDELRDQARESLHAFPRGSGRQILQAVGEEIFEEWFWRGEDYGQAK